MVDCVVLYCVLGVISTVVYCAFLMSIEGKVCLETCISKVSAAVLGICVSGRQCSIILYISKVSVAVADRVRPD